MTSSLASCDLYVTLSDNFLGLDSSLQPCDLIELSVVFIYIGCVGFAPLAWLTTPLDLPIFPSPYPFPPSRLLWPLIYASGFPHPHPSTLMPTFSRLPLARRPHLSASLPRLPNRIFTSFWTDYYRTTHTYSRCGPGAYWQPLPRLTCQLLGTCLAFASVTALAFPAFLILPPDHRTLPFDTAARPCSPGSAGPSFAAPVFNSALRFVSVFLGSPSHFSSRCGGLSCCLPAGCLFYCSCRAAVTSAHFIPACICSLCVPVLSPGAITPRSIFSPSPFFLCATVFAALLSGACASALSLTPAHAFFGFATLRPLFCLLCLS